MTTTYPTIPQARSSARNMLTDSRIKSVNYEVMKADGTIAKIHYKLDDEGLLVLCQGWHLS